MGLHAFWQADRHVTRESAFRQQEIPTCDRTIGLERFKWAADQPPPKRRRLPSIVGEGGVGGVVGVGGGRKEVGLLRGEGAKLSQGWGWLIERKMGGILPQ